MPTQLKIVTEAAAYGSKGQSWNPDFVSYMVEIVTHPVYAGMPDAVKDDGKIQWEAPSNRSGGKYQYTHHRRRDWWRDKACSIGIDPNSDKWISTVAKRVHPTGEKPCKRCGRVMRIAYVYPNQHLQRRLLVAFGETVDVDPLEPITEIVRRVADQLGVERLAEFQAMLATQDVEPPSDFYNVDTWLSWLEDEYVPAEPSLLSPGAMSNAPDRFDGFHSFNLCCRKKADTGRHDDNMRSYTTDRRIFEYWSDGDWIAADRMMGLISARFRSEQCADGGEGPPTADHIGPLSLGFAHRPHFRLLSRVANSAKNNRMTLRDVSDLLATERGGTRVASWYVQALWDLRKGTVDAQELALRLSKQLRDNQRIAMHMLVQVHRAGHFAFLASLLNLERADWNVEFEHLRVEDFVPVFDSLERSPRRTKYAAEQKARRLRVGLEALRAYGEKENRHASVVSLVVNQRATDHLQLALRTLVTVPEAIQALNESLRRACDESDAMIGERQLRELSGQIPRLQNVQEFQQARAELGSAMTEVASVISDIWDTDRYARTPFEEFNVEL